MCHPDRSNPSAKNWVGAERRRAPRLRVELAVELAHGRGTTRDISVGGVFFVTTQVYSPGDAIECVLVFEHLDAGHAVRLHCRGQVVRVEPVAGLVGVAVAITAYRMATPE